MYIFKEIILKLLGVIHKPCGQKGGEGGFPKKPCLSTWGEGGLEACPRGQKCFENESDQSMMVDDLSMEEGMPIFGNINEILVSPFEQLNDKFLE